MHSLGPFVYAALFAITSGWLCRDYVRKLIEVKEARDEMRHGSLGFERLREGRWAIVIWLIVIVILSTILGDWWHSESAGDAVGRFFQRIWWFIKSIGN